MISDEDVAVIARDHLIRWEPLSPYLGLSHHQEAEICQAYPGDYDQQRHKCLVEWKKMKRNEATYSALITAAEVAGRSLLADGVRDLLSRTYMHLCVCIHSMYVIYISTYIGKAGHVVCNGRGDLCEDCS